MRPSLDVSRYSGICGGVDSRLLFLPRMSHQFPDTAFP